MRRRECALSEVGSRAEPLLWREAPPLFSVHVDGILFIRMSEGRLAALQTYRVRTAGSIRRGMVSRRARHVRYIPEHTAAEEGDVGENEDDEDEDDESMRHFWLLRMASRGPDLTPADALFFQIRQRATDDAESACDSQNEDEVKEGEEE